MAKKSQQKAQTMQNKNIVAISLALLLGLFFVAGYFYQTAQNEKSIALSKEQALLFERPHSFVVGNKDAKVQLVEFFDPACGTCAVFHPHVKDILNQYKGKVKLVLRYAPFHKNANYAIHMLEGAREQGKFMEVLDFIFATQQHWINQHVVNPDRLWQLLSQIKGLDMDKLAKYMRSEKGEAIVKQDLEDAKTLNVTKTPGYIVNGKPLQNFSLDNLKALVKSEVER